MVKSIGMDSTSTLSQAMGNLMDAEPMADSSGSPLPVVRTARGRTPAADGEVPAEPASPMPGANRFAGVRRLPANSPLRNPNGARISLTSNYSFLLPTPLRHLGAALLATKETSLHSTWYTGSHL